MRVAGIIGSLALLISLAAAGEMARVKQGAQTAHYRLELQIGPAETMFTPDEVAKRHPGDGEVMVGGMMSMGMSPMTMNRGDRRHLEIYVYSLDKAASVTDAKVAIAVTTLASKKTEMVSATKMYGIKEGPSDTHYGDNVSLPPGSYQVDVTVNGEKARFKVAIPVP